MDDKKDFQIENSQIRHHFDEKSNKNYFSVVDVVGIIANTTDARNYWKVLKNRLNKVHNQLVTECNQLKMKANDGKFYLTDVGDKEMILKMIKLASPDTLSYFERYFDELEHKNRIPVLSLSTNRSESNLVREPTYPQVKKHKQIFQNKKRMKTI